MSTSKPKYYTMAEDAIRARQPGDRVVFQTGLGYSLAPKDKPIASRNFSAAVPAFQGVDPKTGLPNGSPGVRSRIKPPVDPFGPLTAQQIQEKAGLIAQAGLTPQQDEIKRQQALAQKNAQVDAGAIQGFQTAAAGLMAQVGLHIHPRRRYGLSSPWRALLRYGSPRTSRWGRTAPERPPACSCSYGPRAPIGCDVGRCEGECSSPGHVRVRGVRPFGCTRVRGRRRMA